MQLSVFINPPIDTYYVTAGYNEGTYSMTPLPGVYWVPVNSSVTLVVAPQAISCTAFCFYYNLTWVSWTGTGTGSVSSNYTTIAVTVSTSPVNETANFFFTGYCDGFSGTLYCYSAYGYPLTFHETGLPSGTTWGATVVVNSTANGTLSASSTDAWLNESTGQTAVQYTVWTVPDGTTGLYWVPTTTPASPVKEPAQTLVQVTYALVNPTTVAFGANFTALGLPNGTVWSADVGNASYAVTAGNLTVGVPGGTLLSLNGSDVYTEGGVGYYASSVSVFPYVVNLTWQNTTTLPDAFWFNGSAHVYVTYSPMFWLTVSASTGGNVTPASRWVENGAAVALTATADAGYYFLDWTGVGAGGTTTAQADNATATIHPNAPVSELATFRPIPLPTWNVTVDAVGLPTSVGFTFTLGTTAYTGMGDELQIGNLSGGMYAFSAAVAYSAGSNGTRWVPTSWNSSFVPGTGGMLTVGSNGAIQVNFTTQYVLTVASTPDGLVTSSLGPVALGSSWVVAGTEATLTASPSYHYKFVGWNASGNGSVAGMTPTIMVTVAGPVWESAAFEYRVFPAPAVFWLTVTETGLPSDVAWNVSVSTGNASAAGPSASLNLTGLNGTYTLVVPAVYVGPGTRYVPGTLTPVPVTANGTTSVAFSEEFAFTVTGSLGGTVTGAGTTWVGAGAQETLSATPSTGYTFGSWNGTGTGASAPYSGLNSGPTVTVSGPTNESATFVPIFQTHSSGSATAGQVPALGILAVLLVVGLVVGLIVGSRRGGKPPAADDGTAGGASDGGSEAPMDDTYGGSGPGSTPEGAPPTDAYDENAS